MKQKYHIGMFKRRCGCDELLLMTVTMLDAMMNEMAVKMANRQECRPWTHAESTWLLFFKIF
jgi:hypothetical protein